MIKIRGSIWPMTVLGVFTLGLSLVFLLGGRADDTSNFGFPIWVLAIIVLVFSLWIWSCVIYTLVHKRKS